VRGQQLGSPEPLLSRQVILNDRFSGTQSETRRIRAGARRSDKTRMPADSGAHRKPVFRWNILEYLTDFSFQPARREADCVVEQLRHGVPFNRERRNQPRSLAVERAAGAHVRWSSPGCPHPEQALPPDRSEASPTRNQPGPRPVRDVAFYRFSSKVATAETS
jgi:hypothetical protein